MIMITIVVINLFDFAVLDIIMLDILLVVVDGLYIRLLYLVYQLYICIVSFVFIINEKGKNREKRESPHKPDLHNMISPILNLS